MAGLFLCAVVCCSFCIVNGGDAGPGVWSVHDIEICENEKHTLKIELVQQKINRTHDGWDGHFVFEDPFTEGFSVSVEICQLVDGGYRLINEISEPELIEFLLKNCERNVRNALKAVGIDPPEFPVQAGEYDLKDFVFDYSELDGNAFYGEYSGKVKIRHGMDEVFCVLAYVEFSE